MEQLMAANECSPRKNMSVGAPISLLPRIGAFICLLMLTMSAAPAVAQQNESEAQLLARARKIHHRVLERPHGINAALDPVLSRLPIVSHLTAYQFVCLLAPS